jgi:hypothetical protein
MRHGMVPGIEGHWHDEQVHVTTSRNYNNESTIDTSVRTAERGHEAAEMKSWLHKQGVVKRSNPSHCSTKIAGLSSKRRVMVRSSPRRASASHELLKLSRMTGRKIVVGTRRIARTLLGTTVPLQPRVPVYGSATNSCNTLRSCTF